MERLTTNKEVSQMSMRVLRKIKQTEFGTNTRI